MKVLSYKNKPATLPVWQSITLYLLLDNLNATGWVWGVIGTIVALWWLGAIRSILKQEEVNIFELADVKSTPEIESDESPARKSKLQQRLDDEMKKMRGKQTNN